MNNPTQDRAAISLEQLDVTALRAVLDDAANLTETGRVEAIIEEAQRQLDGGSSSPMTPGAGDATQGAKDGAPGTPSDSPPPPRCAFEMCSKDAVGAFWVYPKPQIRTALPVCRDHGDAISQSKTWNSIDAWDSVAT